MDRWKGKVAWVTGASSGIGRAIVERLVARGMRVAASARRVDRLATLEGAHAFPLDVRDENAIGECAQRIVSELGGIDVLVNNAGLGRHAPLCEGPVEAWREMLEVNVLGLAICTQHAVADMHRRGGEGHVIHIASMASHRVPPNSGMYSATKYAVRSLTEGLRQELRAAGSPVRVSAISPGFVETEFAGVYWNDEAKAKETYSSFRVLDAVDVADALEYLLGAPAGTRAGARRVDATYRKTVLPIFRYPRSGMSFLTSFAEPFEGEPPQRASNEGTTNMFNKVELTSPVKITNAIGA